MSTFVPPFIVHVLYHMDFPYGEESFSLIYKYLCRDVKDPYFDGLDIPVYVHRGGGKENIPEVRIVPDTLHVVLLLVDNEMYCDLTWRTYIDHLVSINSNQLIIFPVALCETAFSVNKKLASKQFIRLNEYSIDKNKVLFGIILYDNLLRILKDRYNDKNFKDKTEIFISHSKRDEDYKGLKIAKGLRDHLRINHKISSFFDANDILENLCFGDIIKEHIRNSVLVIIDSDTYSDREWCRIEAIEGKLQNVPIIKVDAIEGKVRRGFPYMSNVPEIRFSNDNYDEIVFLILRTALDQTYQNLFLNTLKSELGLKNTFIQPLPPELFSVHRHHENTDSVLYPEPPLGTEEMEILTSSFKGKSFITPMQALTSNINLGHLKIAVSLSLPQDLQRMCVSEIMFNDMVTEIARHLIIARGDLVYGGDLRPEGFTNILADLAEQYGDSERVSENPPVFFNYVAWPIWKSISKADLAKLISKRVECINVDAPDDISYPLNENYFKPITIEEKAMWARSLSKMRSLRNDASSALIVMGGKISDYSGTIPGIIEEFILAAKQRKPIFILGGMGGAANIICECIEKRESLLNHVSEMNTDSDLQSFLIQNGWDSADGLLNSLGALSFEILNNKLNEEENAILFHSTNIMEVVSLLLKGLNQLL